MTSTALRSTWRLLVDARRAWAGDRAMRLGAGLAYYSLFALVPTMVLAVSLASRVFGQEEVSQQIYDTIARFLDEDLARLVVTAIDQVRAEQMETVLPLVSAGVLLFTATLLFVAWREVVDIIWDEPKRRGIGASLKARGLAVVAVIATGLLLTLTMLAQSLLRSIGGLLGLELVAPLWEAVSAVVPIAVGSLALAILFKYSPQANVSWGSVWLPAVLTMVLLTIGAELYGLYVDTVGLSSASGVAGMALLGLVVVYYASAILLYGVEVVKLSHRRSARVAQPRRLQASSP